MAQFRKKGVWFAAALFAVGLAVVVWWGLQDMHRNVAVHSERISLAEDADPIEEFRTTRQQLRAMQKAQLNDVAHDADTDEELAAMAQRQLLLLCEREEQELTLESVADYIGFSSCYFSRIFKQATGYHFVEYLTLQRVKRAQALLSDTSLNITDISYQSGFKSISTFNRVFKQYRSCSPREYRQYYLN